MVGAPRGRELRCRGWEQEGALRCLLNNLDPEVAENPEALVVYGGRGKAARDPEALAAIVAALERLGGDETLIVQSGKPVAVLSTHFDAPRVLISTAMVVPAWSDAESFRRLEDAGLTIYGQMTAAGWFYIGTQGILGNVRVEVVEEATQRAFLLPAAAAELEAAGSSQAKRVDHPPIVTRPLVRM